MDAVAELILAEAGQLAAPVAVLDDLDGAVTRALVDRGLPVRAWCDDLREERRLPAGTRAGSPATAVAGARTVLWRLPRSLAAVDEYARTIADGAEAAVEVLAGARIKDLTPGASAALGRSFSSVRGSLGVRKARVLHAAGPLPGEPRWPRANRLPGLGLTVVAHGATFATNRLDPGTRLLLGALDRLDGPGRAIDLGCGSGILAAALARRGFAVTATDVSWAACESARLTAAADDLGVEVLRADGLSGFGEASADLIVCNPPFHRGVAKDSGPARTFFADAASVLRPGGEFWTVFNSHLPYLGWLRSTLGTTRVVARDRHYTITRTVNDRPAGEGQAVAERPAVGASSGGAHRNVNER